MSGFITPSVTSITIAGKPAHINPSININILLEKCVTIETNNYSQSFDIVFKFSESADIKTITWIYLHEFDRDQDYNRVLKITNSLGFIGTTNSSDSQLLLD